MGVLGWPELTLMLRFRDQLSYHGLDDTDIPVEETSKRSAD